ncbi:Gelsolin-like domain [Trinorchestia longiramus]|nr:Gelsolin-like domain [Trinorchestia longiramus]
MTGLPDLAVPLYCSPVLYPSAVPQCCAPVLCPSAVPQCCAPVLCPSAVPQCCAPVLCNSHSTPTSNSTRLVYAAMSFQSDSAFNAIPKRSTAFLVWKIQNLNLAPVPNQEIGTFYQGDAYVIYSAAEYGTAGGPHIKWQAPKGSLEINIHFWLGSECSTDEAAVAAIKSVELDTVLGGHPVQHREVEGHESQRFKGYFKNGIRLMKGGTKGGLRKVTDDFTPVLFQVKGKRQVVVKELSKVNWSEMNDGDVFVLATKHIIFVWTGRYSNNSEKLQAAKFATQLKAERGCSGAVVIIEDGHENALQGPERSTFEESLPLQQKNVASHTTAPKDEVVARQVATDLKLYRCNDENKTLKVTEVKTGPLFQEDLISSDAFIVDNGSNGIWVWIGKKASEKERQEAMRNALGFVAKKGYSQSTRTTRVIDGGEPPEFQSLFKNWKAKNEVKVFGVRPKINRQASFAQPMFEAQTLHDRPEVAAATQMVDDGSGQKEIWRINKFNLEPVPEHAFGQFFMGDCYVILYAYSVGSTENYIIYHWQGLHSTKDEQGTAAARSVELDQKLQGRAVIVRVVQGSEPSHFMAIFGGKMVVYEGGHSSGFKSLGQKDEHIKARYMLQVRGTSKHNTKAVEVDFRAGLLNSNDCFLVVTPEHSYLWCGKGSTGDEREMAKQSQAGKAEPLVVMEGHEPAEFWQVLGGKESYASAASLGKGPAVDHPPRLFQCSNASGVFTAQEVLHFTQGDLVEDDVMLLDTWEAVFIWLGVNCNKKEVQRGKVGRSVGAAEEVAGGLVRGAARRTRGVLRYSYSGPVRVQGSAVSRLELGEESASGSRKKSFLFGNEWGGQLEDPVGARCSDGLLNC